MESILGSPYLGKLPNMFGELESQQVFGIEAWEAGPTVRGSDECRKLNK